MTTTIDKNFFAYLKSRGKCSENTVIAYTKNINDFFAYANKSESEIDSFDIMGWAKELSQKYSSATVAQKVCSVKSYMKFLHLFKIIDTNPAESIDAPTIKSKPKHYMDMNMVCSMLKACGNTKYRAIITTYTFTGMRVSELTGLTLKEYKEMKANGANSIVITGKGEKPRTIIFNDATCKAIDTYLVDRNDHGTGCEYLFLSDFGYKISRNHLNDSLKVIARKAGIPFWKDMSNHQLRSACASIYSKNGVPVAVIQSILGHANLATTSRYIKTDEEQMSDAVMSMSAKLNF